MNNLRQIGLATHGYMDDNNGWVPPFENSDGPNVWDDFDWCTHLGPYLGKPLPAGPGGPFHQVGINYLRCPTLNVSPFQPPVGWATYGINLNWDNTPNVTSFGNRPRAPVSTSLPASTFLVGDSGGDRIIFSPSHWPFITSDLDNDGINDFTVNTGVIYNLASPRHGRGLNFVFMDGHVEWVSLKDFLTNKNNLWGP